MIRYNRELAYRRGATDTIAHRTCTTPEANFSQFVYKLDHPKGHFDTEIVWSNKVTPANMTWMIQSTDATNPLYITASNPDLKDTRTNNFKISMSYWASSQGTMSHSLSFMQQDVSDDVVTGWNYNPETGVRYVKHYNVHGNRQREANYTFSFSPDHLLIYAALTYRNRRSADMVSDNTTDITATPQQQYVYTNSFAPTIKFSYSFEKIRLRAELHCDGDVNRYRGDAADFQGFTATTMQYGAKLYWSISDFSFNATLNTYSRFGYSDSKLNTTEPVLNLGAQWTWKKPGINFMVDAYDVLQQIQTVSYSINAQGRTERWTNSIPRYILFRISYMFNLNTQSHKN